MNSPIQEPQEPLFHEAVCHFWKTRSRQASAQARRGKKDQGQRSAATGGRQLDGFCATITHALLQSGVPESDIFHAHRRSRYIPGFFRATKEWDLLVVSSGKLLAAIELKAHVGPSFGNNFNNRTEEALGSATDLWTAYREGAFGCASPPWLGYLLLLETCPESTRPCGVYEPHFPVLEEFRGASYAVRYELFCRKLMLERKYSRTCLLLSHASWAEAGRTYIEPCRELGGRAFVHDLTRHVCSFYPSR